MTIPLSELHSKWQQIIATYVDSTELTNLQRRKVTVAAQNLWTSFETKINSKLEEIKELETSSQRTDELLESTVSRLEDNVEELIKRVIKDRDEVPRLIEQFTNKEIEVFPGELLEVKEYVTPRLEEKERKILESLEERIPIAIDSISDLSKRQEEIQTKIESIHSIVSTDNKNPEQEEVLSLLCTRKRKERGNT